MRQLHYLAIILVFFAVASLAWARVASTPAYAIRVEFSKLRPGVAQCAVRRRMEAVKDAQASLGDTRDVWLIAGHYSIAVDYEKSAPDSEEAVLKSKSLYLFSRGDATGEFLEFLGLPKARVIWFG
jgi:hypothetical protein